MAELEKCSACGLIIHENESVFVNEYNGRKIHEKCCATYLAENRLFCMRKLGWYFEQKVGFERK